jgi:hypothetical protein
LPVIKQNVPRAGERSTIADLYRACAQSLARIERIAPPIIMRSRSPAGSDFSRVIRTVRLFP